MAKAQENSLGSEVFRTATELKEALRPVVAFKGELEKAQDMDQLRLTLLETNLPYHITKVLDMHQALMMSLALVSKVEEPTTIEDRVEKELVHETLEAERQELQPGKDSFLYDDD